jgi:hypothetical protein
MWMGRGLPGAAGRDILPALDRERRAAMTMHFWRYRKRGPVHALQMRLQG